MLNHAALAQAAATPVAPLTTSPIERALPEPQPRAVPPLLPAPAPGAPEVPAGPPVTIQAVEIQGATAYKPDEIEPYYSGIVGKSVPLGQISTVLQQIQTKYRNDGYVLTVVRGTVEPVDGRSTLRIRVVEGFISDVKIDGDIGPAGILVYNFLNKLTSIRPVNIADIERALLLAQDVPGISVRAVLRPGTGEAGAVELIGQVGRKPFGGFVQYDNRGPPFAGPHELLVGAQANSFTSVGERTEIILYDTPFNKEQMFGQAGIEGFVGANGLKLRAYGGYGPSEPSGALGQVGFRSRLLIAGASAAYPVIRTRPVSLNVTLAFDISRAEISEANLGTGARQQTSLDDLRIVRLGETLDFQDQTFGTGLVSANTVALTLHQGLSGLGASTTGDRPGTRVDFFKLTGELTRVQNLFGFNGGLVALKLSAGGQYSGDILPSNEKYFLGGTKFGRGFFSGEITGDRAAGTTSELQLNTSTDWPVSLGLQPFIFYDTGWAWNLAPGDLDEHVESAGVGVRISLTQMISLELEGDRRFTRKPTGANVSPLSPYAGFVTLIARF
ncbi:MAG TPA: ShlB/FhaC/HecB family hemolysin secretion/activation protein [Alphaproteobacteria bacterium]